MPMTRLVVPSLSGGSPHVVELADEKWRCDCPRFSGSQRDAKDCRHVRIAHAVRAAVERCFLLGHKVEADSATHEGSHDRVCVPCLVALVTGMTRVVKDRYLEKPKCTVQGCGRPTTRKCPRCKRAVCGRCPRAGRHLVGKTGCFEEGVEP